MKFYPVQIANIDRPSKEVMTLYLDIADSEMSAFDYSPGQHIVLRMMFDGQEIRRPIALSSSPFADDRPAITFERVKGGLFSSYIFGHAEVGMALHISEAHGFFYADINSGINQNYFLFAQGICVTPVFSILRSILLAETTSRVYFYYESRNRESIIFNEELNHLIDKYANRFVLLNTLSNPGILPRLKPWHGQKGKINASSIKNLLNKYPPEKSDMIYVCGDPELVADVRNTFQLFNISEDRIHSQHFHVHPSTEEKIGDFKSTVIHVKDHPTTINGARNKPLLMSLKEASYAAPFACQSGICGTCAAKLSEGTVEMKSTHALTPADIEKGWILTCQACPASDEIHIEF